MSITTSTTGFEHLIGRLRGTLALRDEPGYELARPWNVAVPVAPRAVVAVATVQDVVETVRFAAGHGLRVAVQRTGHGAVPMAGDDLLLVHTAGLDELIIDPVARTARVGAGVIWQAVLDAAAPHGLGALCGSSPHVGVAGFLTGGGVGPFVRQEGLSADHVRAFELVTGKGELLRVTPDDHAELFWGLRGGKGTLGIVTAVEIDLFEAPTFHGGALYFAAQDAATVVHAWRDWADALPDDADTSIAVLQLPPLPDVPPPLAGKLTVAVRFTTLAGAGRAAELLAPMRAVATPVIDAIAEYPYAAVAAVHADPVDPMPTHESSGLLREFPAEAVEALLAVAGPGSDSPQVVVELRRLGGALARPEAHRSAFCHRDAAYSVLAIGVLAPEIAAIVPVHGQAVIDALAPWTTGGVFPNFAPGTDPARLARAYDGDTVVWLSALADQLDPAGVFRVGQVVRR